MAFQRWLANINFKTSSNVKKSLASASVTGEIYTQDGDFIKDIEINDLRNRYTLTKGATQKMVNMRTLYKAADVLRCV